VSAPDGDRLDYVALTRRELARLLSAVRAGPVSDPVPTCPGWSVADLVSHVGEFCAFWTHVLCEGTGAPRAPFADPPRGDAVAGWLEGIGQMLVTELQATPSHTRVWTWYERDSSARFVARRVAHELAVHRYDAELARGMATPIATRLAADGIDELLGTLVTARQRSGTARGQTLGLHGTDEDGIELLVVMKPDVIEVTRSRDVADLTLTGSVSDLELLLYRRPTIGPVEKRGDAEVLEVWYREFVF
jgi:uncharacterized protein (TIGR03083 family)